jgi:uncharacterized membrane protein
MDGTDGMDRLDRRENWDQDPPGSTQDEHDEQRSHQAEGFTDPREVPAVLPGRFLRNPAPSAPQRQSMPPIPAEDATPTRSVPVLSRPGYLSGVGGASPVPSSPAPSGAYIVEETQEMVVMPGASSSSLDESSAPRPRVVNAAGAAAAAYQQFDRTGSYPAAQPQPWARNGDGAPRYPGQRNAEMAADGSGADAAGDAGPSYQRMGPVGRAAAPPAGHDHARAALPPAGVSLFGPAVERGTVTIVLSANHAAAFSYLFGFLTGIFFYFGERENRYVRFHAWQSSALSLFLIFLGVFVYGGVWLEFIKVDDPAWNVVTLIAATLVAFAMFLLWLWVMAEAWVGHYVRLPIIGYWAEYFAAPHAAYSQEP